MSKIFEDCVCKSHISSNYKISFNIYCSSKLTDCTETVIEITTWMSLQISNCFEEILAVKGCYNSKCNFIFFIPSLRKRSVDFSIKLKFDMRLFVFLCFLTELVCSGPKIVRNIITEKF